MGAFALLGGVCFTLAPSLAQPQIYECVGENGGRIFSDERCGPDAKIVAGIASAKRASPHAPKPKKVVLPAAELEALSATCDAGDMDACKRWSVGGGPGLLRDKERKAELECEAGSLEACEKRYCSEGVDAECRARVLRTAPLAGEEWYLRQERRAQPDGLVQYQVRCMPEDGATRDIVVLCATERSPNRCYVVDPQHAFPRLDRAAEKHCAE
ncbi:MAG TPA: DUF4124 domain-containing protein [Steroidobacter sp.]|jgi:hypothetical protein|nr:DUF4124 domain-containing protein [Steroidobacter sp.]